MFLRLTFGLISAFAITACASSGISPQIDSFQRLSPTSEHARALRTQLDASASEMLGRHNVPSVAVAYLSDGEIQWTANYGEQSPGRPADADTLYNVASVTKAVVAETMLRLAAEGRIDLDAPMAAAFIDPDLSNDERARTITPSMALSHRTGFAENWRRDMDGGRLAISWDPGTRAAYSGENFEYMARFAEAALDATLTELARNEVFNPVGMENTWFTPSPAWEGHVAMVRGRDGTQRLPSNVAEPSAADDMHATIDDFAKFLRSAMDGEGLTPELIEARGTIYDDQVEQACPPGVIPPELCAEHTGFGLGWLIFDSGENRFLVHNGKDWGERAIILFEPEKRYGVAVFTSGANGRSVISEVLQILVPDAQLNALVAAEARFDR